MKKIKILIIVLLPLTTLAQQNFDKILLGHHLVSLQWISLQYFGTANITKSDKKGEYNIVGSQESKTNTDYLKLTGTIKPITKDLLSFEGTIETKIYHINEGNVCRRVGTYNFKATGKRRYWRLQEMDNPCDRAADYIDIYYLNK